MFNFIYMLHILHMHKQFQRYTFIRNMKNIHIYVFFSNFPIFLHVNFSRGLHITNIAPN